MSGWWARWRFVRECKRLRICPKHGESTLGRLDDHLTELGFALGCGACAEERRDARERSRTAILEIIKSGQR